MTRSELIKAITVQKGVPEAQVESVLAGIIETIAMELHCGNRVSIHGMGRFEMRTRGPKAFVNPKTGVTHALPPQKTVGFKASPAFKAKVASYGSGK